MLQLALLRHVADLRAAISLRWEGWRAAVPHTVAELLAGCEGALNLTLALALTLALPQNPKTPKPHRIKLI